MSRFVSTPNAHATANLAPIDYAKNLILLGLAGVGAKILLILTVHIIQVYFFQTDIAIETTEASWSLFALTALEADLSEYVLMFGVVVAFAYKFGCVVPNQRNFVLCIVAALASELVTQLAFSSWMLEMFNMSAEVEGYIHRPNFAIRIDHHGDMLPTSGYAFNGQLYFVATMLLSMVVVQMVFKCSAKNHLYNSNIPAEQIRFIMLLAYACVLRSLFPTITEPDFSIASTNDYIYVNLGDFVWMHYVDVLPSVFFLPSIWVCYVFAARYFPKEYVAEKRDTVSYAIGTIVCFFFLFIASLLVIGFIFTPFERHPIGGNEIIFPCIFSIACLIWIYVRIRSLMVCLLLLTATSMPFILSYTAITGSVFLDKAFKHHDLFAFPARFIALELLFWLVYSKAIQYGVRFMIKPGKAKKPISIKNSMKNIYNALFRATENDSRY